MTGDGADGAPTAPMPPPVVDLPARFKPFTMKDIMYIQAVQKYNSRGGKSSRVLILRPQLLLLASEKPVVVTRTIRLQKIVEILVERTGPGGQLGIIVKDDFGVKMVFPKDGPTLDDFITMLGQVMRSQGKLPPKVTEVPEGGKSIKNDGLHARMTKSHIKKPSRFVPPLTEAVEYMKKNPRENRAAPPRPPEGPSVEMQGMPSRGTPVANSPSNGFPESPSDSPPPSPPASPPPKIQPTLEEVPKPDKMEQSGRGLAKPRTTSQPQLVPERSSLQIQQGEGYQGMGEPRTGGSDGYEPHYRRGVPPPLQVIDSSPYYVDPYRPIKNRVDFNHCEGVINDSPRCESPHSHHSIGSPTELNLHRNHYNGDWLMRSMADALELEITELEERNQAMRLELMKEKEMRHKNELQLHEKVAALCKRVEQQQKIIDMYEQRDVLKEKLGKQGESPARVASTQSGGSFPTYYTQTNVEQVNPHSVAYYHHRSAQPYPSYTPMLDSNSPVFSTSAASTREPTPSASPPRYCPQPFDPPSTASVRSTRLLNLI
eukprot:TRINITY_DN20578_c1_g1_i1.p1 TRINITY_DN20578_c1_g1~~TRINITY_DN20578_c1_g1_i1.p1  ORF type:complete len:544 (+),score=88.40 TRINITY_DN20578_c1_g1_i1:39-1670(+)